MCLAVEYDRGAELRNRKNIFPKWNVKQENGNGQVTGVTSVLPSKTSNFQIFLEELEHLHSLLQREGARY